MNSHLKKTLLAASIAASLGTATTPANADILNFSYEGLFTLLAPNGAGIVNSGNNYSNNWFNSAGMY